MFERIRDGAWVRIEDGKIKRRAKDGAWILLVKWVGATKEEMDDLKKIYDYVPPGKRGKWVPIESDDDPKAEPYRLVPNDGVAGAFRGEWTGTFKGAFEDGKEW